MTSQLQILTDQVVGALRQVCGPSKELTLLHRPYLPANSWTYVKECMDTGWVSSAGAYVAKFEEALAQFTGARRAVAVVNGTAALQVCLKLAGVEPNDEVITPSLTFIATANAVSYCGATPHFVDVCPSRFGMDAVALRDRLEQVGKRDNGHLINQETGRRIAAVCPMHCFGHACQIEEIKAVCDQYQLPLVEDAAESLGSWIGAKHTGRFGTLAAISFNGNKILTTGGGGAIITDSEELADKAKHLTTTAKCPHAWEFEHDEIGWNFRMPNINAAMGLAQLEVLDKLLAAKRQLHSQYQAEFKAVDGLTLLDEPVGSKSNYWLNCLLIDDSILGEFPQARDALLQATNEAKYQCRPLWKPMHQLSIYSHCPAGPLVNTEALYRKSINIPSSADLASNWEQLVA